MQVSATLAPKQNQCKCSFCTAFVCLLHQYFIVLYCFLCLFCCFLVYSGNRILAYGVISGRRAHTSELLFWTLIHLPPNSLIQFDLCLYAMAHWVECYWNPFALFTCGDNNHIKVITANALRSLMWFPLWRFNIFPCTIAEHAVAMWRGKKASYRLSLLPFSIWSHLSCLILCLTRLDGVRRSQHWCILTALHFLSRT